MIVYQCLFILFSFVFTKISWAQETTSTCPLNPAPDRSFTVLSTADLGSLKLGEHQVYFYCTPLESLNKDLRFSDLYYVVKDGKTCLQKKIPDSNTSFSNHCRLKVEKENDLLKITDKDNRHNKTKERCVFNYLWNSKKKELLPSHDNCRPIKPEVAKQIFHSMVGEFKEILKKGQVTEAENFLNVKKDETLKLADAYSPSTLFHPFEERLYLYKAYQKWSQGQIEEAKSVLKKIPEYQKYSTVKMCPSIYKLGKNGELIPPTERAYYTRNCYGTTAVTDDSGRFSDFIDPRFSLFLLDYYYDNEDFNTFDMAYTDFRILDDNFRAQHEIKYLRKYRNSKLQNLIVPDEQAQHSSLLKKDLEEASLGELKYKMQHFCTIPYKDYFELKMRIGQCESIEPEVFELLVPKLYEEITVEKLKSTVQSLSDLKEHCKAENEQSLAVIKIALTKKCQNANEEFVKLQAIKKACQISKMTESKGGIL